MRGTLQRFCVLGMIAFAAALTLLESCSPPASSRDRVLGDLFFRIDSLRVVGRYREALADAERLDVLASRPGTRMWRMNDARRLKDTLRQIVSLPPAGQRDLAEADSLTPVIERFMSVDEDYVAAMNAASRQLELRSRRLGPTHLDVATSLHLLGRIANQSGEGERCQEYLENAMAIRRAQLGPRHPLVAQTLREWGILMKTRLKLPEADSAYLEALAILESAYPKDDPSLAPVLESLGSLYRLRKRFAPAEDFYLRALKIRRLHNGENSVEVAENLVWLGYARMYASRLGPAEEALLLARDILRDHGMFFTHDMGDVTWNLAIIAWLQGNTARAADLWEQYSLCQTNIAGSHPQGFGLARLRGLVGEWIDALLCEGRFDAAWQVICRDSGPVAQSLMNLSAARRRWSGDAARLDSLRSELLTLRRRAQYFDTSPNASAMKEPQSSNVIVSSTGMADSLEIPLARVDGQRMILEQELLTRFSSAPGGDRVSPENIQSRLAPDQAIVGWVPGLWNLPGVWKATLWAYVLRHEGRVEWIHIGTWNNANQYTAWSSSSYRWYRAMLRSSQWPHRVVADSGLDSLAADTWRKMFQPLMPYLNGVHELIVVDGHTIPARFVVPECLVDDHDVPLVERFAFSFVPSPVVFARLTDENRRNPNHDRSIVALGDPLGPPRNPSENTAVAENWSRGPEGHSGTTFISPTLVRNALMGDREALSQLPVLPDARREVLKAASVFPVSTVLLGPAATRAELASALRQKVQLGVLHFATHALVDREQPERSLLVMSLAGSSGTPATRSAPSSGGSGALTARSAPSAVATGATAVDPDALDSGCMTSEEVLLGRQFDVDLVTLSGCQTYQGSGAQGGEDLGFAQSFLAAGARCLLLSRWKVDDQATTLLMGRFYENMTGSYRDRRAGLTSVAMSKARALQEAQVWLRHWQASDGTTPFAHPVYWAGFVLVGAAD